jgi:hypothetical protein
MPILFKMLGVVRKSSVVLNNPGMTDITPPPTPASKEMPPIDLTLAVNYIPAVVCLGKAALISFCLRIIHPGARLPGRLCGFGHAPKPGSRRVLRMDLRRERAAAVHPGLVGD